MTCIKNPTNNKCWRRCGGKRNFLHYWWECKSVQQTQWRTVWMFLKKLKLESPYDLAIPLLGIYPEKRKSQIEVTQSCPTLCNSMDCKLPSSSIHGLSQARILEWVAISFSRRSSRPRDWTRVSHIVGRHFTF